NGMSVSVVNYSASTAAISTTPTINSGGGCVSGTGIPSGDAWQLFSNGTTLDCVQTIATSSGGSMTWPAAAGIANYSGSSSWGTSYSATNAIPANFLPAALSSST